MILLGSPSVGAQAPGPMSKTHSHLSGPLDCQRCHDGAKGVTEKKCLGCHDHRNLKLRIEAEKGFHAHPKVREQECKDCHPEHKDQPSGSGKARRSTIDWRPFGGRRQFEHRMTGWPLLGAHRFESCEECHTRKSKKTGLSVFLGLRGECTTCHDNPHKFRDMALTDCTVCHNFKNRRVANLGVTKFDHDQTKFKVKGQHAKNSCVKCHLTTKEFTITDRKFQDCSGCHKDPHRSVISASRKCNDCHDTKVKFEQTKFAHGKKTSFTLRGEHLRNKCEDCHKVGSKPVKPDKRCVSCHEDIHKGRFGKRTCDACHVETGWKKSMVFNHAKTGFTLSGAHRSPMAKDCAKCHRNRDPEGFEKLKVDTCADCHEHTEAHCGQFGRENCERCHVRGGDKTSRFDHNITGFKLVGAHAVPDCSGCHKREKLGTSKSCKQAIQYTGLRSDCASCHEDIHKGELGADCERCHTGGRDFKTLAFDHNRDSRFSLTGFHQLVLCSNCHPNRRYKLDDIRCESCHLEDDAHATVLGDDCGQCHETSGGAPKFDHDLHTKFPREGVHAQIRCQRCHFLPAPKTDARKELLKKLSVIEIPPAQPLDLQFRAEGGACLDCHPDPHQVRDNVDCGGCHGAESWKNPPRNGYHENAGFSLTGAHNVLACEQCHNGVTRLSGRAQNCGTCHQQDDVHSGSFGSECGQCHEQNAWLPTTFTHMATSYSLRGVHRTLDCRSCHQSGNYFIPNRCYNCHLSDYRKSEHHQNEILSQVESPDSGGKIRIGGYQDPDTGNYLTLDCDQCHNEFTFMTGTFKSPEQFRK